MEKQYSTLDEVKKKINDLRTFNENLLNDIGSNKPEKEKVFLQRFLKNVNNNCNNYCKHYNFYDNNGKEFFSNNSNSPNINIIGNNNSCMIGVSPF